MGTAPSQESQAMQDEEGGGHEGKTDEVAQQLLEGWRHYLDSTVTAVQIRSLSPHSSSSLLLSSWELSDTQVYEL